MKKSFLRQLSKRTISNIHHNEESELFSVYANKNRPVAGAVNATLTPLLRESGGGFSSCGLRYRLGVLLIGLAAGLIVTFPTKDFIGSAVMDRWKGRVALVTGASVGIGAAIAKELVRYGMKVVGCARDIDKLQKLAAECQAAGHSGVFVPFKCDLNNVDEILSMFSAIREQHKGVDVCINNAGLAHPEPLLSGKTSGWKNMLDVNVLALSICTREAYQSMKERNVDDGHIINLNSVCGHRVVNVSNIHFYTATKYAVTALTEGLRQELREAKTHIRATCISPGVVETEFAQRVYPDDPEKAAATYSNLEPLQAIDVANAVTYVLSAPSHVQIGDIQMRPVEQVS